MKAEVFYSGNDIAKLIDLADAQGWTLVPFADTVCGLGSFVLVPPDDRYYNIIVTEYYATEWSCKYTVRRRAKLSKKLLKAIEDYEREGENA